MTLQPGTLKTGFAESIIALPAKSMPAAHCKNADVQPWFYPARPDQDYNNDTQKDFAVGTFIF